MQNIDGMHQQAGSTGIIELHSNLWHLRCEQSGTPQKEDFGRSYETLRCDCGEWLRPGITCFGDTFDETVMRDASEMIATCDLFVSASTSGLPPSPAKPESAASKSVLSHQSRSITTWSSGNRQAWRCQSCSAQNERAALEHVFDDNP